jgi:hypothetical protein
MMENGKMTRKMDMEFILMYQLVKNMKVKLNLSITAYKICIN